ncbi:hypothetical protein JW872_03060 [Candidatus Babeliales bacterium]|nr:hypothetical protein [Candidatus Babeliales bacterium]
MQLFRKLLVVCIVLQSFGACGNELHFARPSVARIKEERAHIESAHSKGLWIGRVVNAGVLGALIYMTVPGVYRTVKGWVRPAEQQQESVIGPEGVVRVVGLQDLVLATQVQELRGDVQRMNEHLAHVEPWSFGQRLVNAGMAYATNTATVVTYGGLGVAAMIYSARLHRWMEQLFDGEAVYESIELFLKHETTLDEAERLLGDYSRYLGESFIAPIDREYLVDAITNTIKTVVHDVEKISAFLSFRSRELKRQGDNALELCRINKFLVKQHVPAFITALEDTLNGRCDGDAHELIDEFFKVLNRELIRVRLTEQ